MRERTDGLRRWVVLVSPIVVIGVSRMVQQVAGLSLGVWAWVPAMLTFWGLIGCLIAWGRRGNRVTNWLSTPRGSALWSALAVLVGFVSVREFVAGWRVLESPGVLVLWLAFGVVNPWFEEGYWRGLLIDAAVSHRGLGVVYSTVVFAVSHPLIWGMHSVALRHPASLVGLGLVGGVWGVAYWRTGSLRWTIVGHTCANLLGLSVPILLNLHVPAGLK
jgi:membrane protease YdiL (CAAX protease family)